MTQNLNEQSPRILGLCSGAGHLDRAVESVTGGRLVAYAEKMPAAAKVMAYHYPRLPNLGDITALDWDDVRDEHAPDVISAGWPCQNISDAGKREGINGDRSKLWRNVAQAVGVIRPRLVFLENVDALRSPGRGMGVVASDLAAIGYELRWVCIPASGVGAPHPRKRFFGVARPR